MTGGSGFLGRAIAEVLPGALALASTDLDLTDGTAVSDFVAEHRPDVVIHLAARVGGLLANMERPADFLVDNLRIDANLLAALRIAKPRHLIALLSTCMYPGQVADAAYPMAEQLLDAGPPPETNASYATGKRALWRGVLALHQQYGVPYTCLVPANLYGPGDHFGSQDSHFLAAAIHKIEAARRAHQPEVRFFGTGGAFRQYVYVRDLARLVGLLVERGPLNTTLNVAPDGHQTIRQLADAVADAAGYVGDIAFTGEGPDGQLRKDVSSARLRSLVPEWSTHQTSFADGLLETLRWFRAHVEAR